MYLFDAQNRWGYELIQAYYSNEIRVYLFDAQNRWGYEASIPKQLKENMYLFDAQNRWGYESSQYF